MLTSNEDYQKCSICLSPNLLGGKIVGSNEVIFSLSQSGKAISETSKAIACVDCGHIHLGFNSKSLKIRFVKK